jgi:hypothetical protein
MTRTVVHCSTIGRRPRDPQLEDGVTGSARAKIMAPEWPEVGFGRIRQGYVLACPDSSTSRARLTLEAKCAEPPRSGCTFLMSSRYATTISSSVAPAVRPSTSSASLRVISAVPGCLRASAAAASLAADAVSSLRACKNDHSRRAIGVANLSNAQTAAPTKAGQSMPERINSTSAAPPSNHDVSCPSCLRSAAVGGTIAR